MKETDKYIDQLFEAAKNESPKISFEQMTQRFESAIQPPSVSPVGQSWWSQFLNLNTILLLSIGIFIIAFFFSRLPPSTEQSSISVEQELQKKEVMATIITENKTSKTSDTSISKVEKTIVLSTILGEDKGAKKAIIPKNDLINLPSITYVSTNLTNSSIVKVEAVDISNAPLTTKNAEKLITEAAKNTSYSARGVEEPAKPAPNEIIKSTNLEIEVPMPNKITEPTKEITDSKSILLQLNYADSHEITQLFISHLKQYGFKVYNRVTRNPKQMQKIVLEITHKNGLEWKLKLRNFEELEFKVYLDKNDQVNSIAYRLNQQGDFSEPLKLYHKAKSNHKFSTNNTRGSHSFTRKSHLKNNQ